MSAIESCKAKVRWTLDWKEYKMKTNEQNEVIDVQSNKLRIGTNNAALGIRKYKGTKSGLEKIKVYFKPPRFGKFDVNMYLTNDNKPFYKICSVKGLKLYDQL